MKYIIGLGNPGREYEYTRHNIGFLILADISIIYQFTHWEHDKYIQADVATGTIDGVDYTLVKPTTFMNNSGLTIQGLIKKKVDPSDIVIIYDDLAYPFGIIRLAQEKSDGGHNGIASIIKVLPIFLRIRVGIHSVKPGTDELVELKNSDHTARADFVLKDFRPDEIVLLHKIREQVVNILKSIEILGVDKTMTEVNKRK
jgi:PTH1 family peptidyl-tRNA hydrolase